MLAKRNPPPRFLGNRGARFRLAYNLYGWQVLLFGLLVVPIGGFIWWATVSGVRLPTPLTYASTPRGFVQNDGTIFQAEILYAAAHRYAALHDGRLPSANTWQTALRPNLARAGAEAVLRAVPTTDGKGRFVMNRALSGAHLASVPNASRTLLFWQAVTNTSALPPSAYQTSRVAFGGVACDGKPYYLLPTGDRNEPLIWHTAQPYQPPHDAPFKE